ncbi:ABC transporter substrate-binding protein [Dictyobacter kobayashii]|uniref:Solute-binding protein family 5 domain-containing protein n=1 Tax=Dictyobacter kobayashii TaxID=2014872 RepID=A0A402AY02_9CHLR|nr:ABC transporter substrate-binding protein [Dictyobacter kobayashii]GCE23986.1 hypothetical protein KDK_77860 [Dictyobacter kobayashii]
MISAFVSGQRWRPKKLWSTAIVSTLLALMVVLTSCGTSGAPGQSSSSKGTSALTVNPSPKGDNPSNFNPLLDPQNTAYGTQGFLYETLLFINRYTGDKTPWLASSYQQSSDLSSITFTIRDGVKWNDGQPLTSDDVVYTFDLLKQ